MTAGGSPAGAEPVTVLQRLRLFVAIETPKPWHEALQAQSSRLRDAAPGFGRWTGPETWHVTLAFLGNQPLAAVPAVSGALDAAVVEHQAFRLRPEGLGCFRRGRQVQVVWAGLEDDPPGALARLRASVVQALLTAQILFEQASFQPHVTLARARRRAGPSDSAAVLQGLSSPRPWAVGMEAICADVRLYQSELRPTGAVYTCLHSARLGAQ